MVSERLTVLFKKYVENRLSDQEIEELQTYIDEASQHPHLRELISRELYAVDEDSAHSHDVEDLVKGMETAVWKRIEERENASRVDVWKKWGAVAASVAILLSMGIGIYWYQRQDMEVVSSNDPAPTTTQDIAPGTNRATLVLSNGKIIPLSESQEGIQLVDQHIRYADGSVVLEETNVQYATLSVPRAGQYQVVLPDGSKVWLNSESSLKYPTAFAGNERRVELEGEGFFDVSTDPARPFIVSTANQSVEVLGTQFNINNYPEGGVSHTTVLEGSVRIATKKGGETKVLTPGQQAIISTRGIRTRNIETEYVIAWKNGYFMFDNETLGVIMEKLSRWYDVEVVFKDASLKDRTFFGSISRFENISKILNIIARTDVANFDIHDGKIIISNK